MISNSKPPKKMPETPSGSFSFAHILPLGQMAVDARKEFWATLALKHTKGIGLVTQNSLLNYFFSACNAIAHINDWPLAGVKEACIREYKKGEWRKKAMQEWNEAKNCDAAILLGKNEQYPYRLRNFGDRAVNFYCLGNPDLFRQPAIAIVGSRNASGQGCEIAYHLAKALADAGLTVISGMANGIDRYAHLGALAGTAKSIGVLGTGINLCYPRANRDLYAKMRAEGLLVSEFSPDCPPSAINFPVRNRLISGLALGVVVVEAAIKSGSLITAQYAKKQGRTIFAVPGTAYDKNSAGCQNLIRMGARPVFAAGDILKALYPVLKGYARMNSDLDQATEQISLDCVRPEASPKTDNPAEDSFPNQIQKDFKGREIIDKELGKDAAAQIRDLLAAGAMHIDTMADRLNMEVDVMTSNLVYLEMLGEIERLPGSRYKLK